MPLELVTYKKRFAKYRNFFFNFDNWPLKHYIFKVSQDRDLTLIVQSNSLKLTKRKQINFVVMFLVAIIYEY